MADFCKQCTEELFGEESAYDNDLRDIVSLEDSLVGVSAIVLCEGCGPIQVNHVGECLSVDCDKQHGSK